MRRYCDENVHFKKDRTDSVQYTCSVHAVLLDYARDCVGAVLINAREMLLLLSKTQRRAALSGEVLLWL
jgi:hypothetical protein